jgi:hypothetical protein
LFTRRLEALLCLLHSADHMVAYQAQLDRVKSLAVPPEPNPVLGVQSSWDRTDLMETARKEIDSTIRLMRLLKDTPEPLLDLAPVPEEETIMRLGPDLVAQLKRKVDITCRAAAEQELRPPRSRAVRPDWSPWRGRS